MQKLLYAFAYLDKTCVNYALFGNNHVIMVTL